MADKETIYQFSAENIDGKSESLEKYRGNVVLVVNVASQCGFTDSNYKQLKELQDTYHQQGLRIAAFPCNQFGHQEPRCASDIKNFVNQDYKFEPDLFGKIDVNGNEAHPLFTFLKEKQSGTLGSFIKWNFTKFLVDRHGRPIKRYSPTTEPKKLVADIEKALNEKNGTQI